MDWSPASQQAPRSPRSTFRRMDTRRMPAWGCVASASRDGRPCSRWASKLLSEPLVYNKILRLRLQSGGRKVALYNLSMRSISPYDGIAISSESRREKRRMAFE